MPATNEKNYPKTTISFAYQADAFGTGSYKSMPIKQEDLEVVKSQLVVGSRILLKKLKTNAKYGGEQIAIEVLAPYDGKKAEKSEESDI